MNDNSITQRHVVTIDISRDFEGKALGIMVASHEYGLVVRGVFDLSGVRVDYKMGVGIRNLMLMIDNSLRETVK
jgi:hypothetical protein